MRLLWLALFFPFLAHSDDNSGCSMKRLRFSADNYPSLPAAGADLVWGGNATNGDHVIDPPYNEDFLSRVRRAKAGGIEVFAYFEGPCGDTDGHDDGEKARCRKLHNDFNARFAKGTPDDPAGRWKPFTMRQLQLSKDYGIDYCEVDNLDNQVTIPLIPFLREYKKQFDAGQIYCRIVLKNVGVSGINAIIQNLAPTPPDAGFIAPFAIYESRGTGAKPALDAAMRRLKGSGAETIISTDSNHYGRAFTQNGFLTCRK